MRRLFIVIILEILAGKLFCQQGFYIKPLSYKKSFYIQDPFNITLHTKAGNTYQLETQNYVTIPGFDIGLLVGYNFKYLTIETGLIRDGSESGFNLKGFSYNRSDSTFSGDFYKVRGGIGFYNFPLRLHYTIYSKDSLRHDRRNISAKIGLFAGFDFAVFPNTDKTPIDIGGVTWDMGNNQHAEITDALASRGERWSRLNALGIELQIYKRGINLCNVSLWTSIGSYALTTEQLTIKDTDGTKYRYNFWGNGSGIYLSWTKEINLRNTRHHIQKAWF